jgi:dihydroneopterin aldolase
MAEDRVFVEGLEFVARHGVFEHERREGCRFRLDLELRLDLSGAGESDKLRDAIDYAVVARRALAVVDGPSVHLLERLATLICEALLADFPADEVTVTLRKLAPAIQGAPGAVGVRLTRRRPAAS